MNILALLNLDDLDPVAEDLYRLELLSRMYSDAKQFNTAIARVVKSYTGLSVPDGTGYLDNWMRVNSVQGMLNGIRHVRNRCHAPAERHFAATHLDPMFRLVEGLHAIERLTVNRGLAPPLDEMHYRVAMLAARAGVPFSEPGAAETLRIISEVPRLVVRAQDQWQRIRSAGIAADHE